MNLKFPRRSSFGYRVLIGTTATLIFVAFANSGADEPSIKEPAATTDIDTPFDPDTMPAAEKLLAENVLGSKNWTAKISITATSTFAPKNGSLSGLLAKQNSVLSGKLQVDEDADRAVNLSITKERAVAWTIPDEQDNERLERLVRSIFLLEMLSPFPDESQSRSDLIGEYLLTNLGVTKRDGEQFYVVRAEPKVKASSSRRHYSLQADRILITFSCNDSEPRQIAALSNKGTVLVLNFESITNDAQENRQQTEPPKEAFVIDLSGKPVGSGALTNPVSYSPESIKRGKQLYIADCEVCHSVDGTGRDSDVTDNAADLTNTEFWLSDGSETATFLAIRDGAGDEMPGYKDDYRDEKMIWDLVNYMRSLQE